MHSIMTNTSKTNHDITFKTSELFRPTIDRCVGGLYRGNHTGYHVNIHRDGDKVTVLHAWGHSFNGFSFHEEKVFSVAEELNRIAVSFAELHDNPKLDDRFTIEIVDDLPEGHSVPEWKLPN